MMAILQFNESCASGFDASALIKNEPSPNSPLRECSLLLSIMWTCPPSLSHSPIFFTLYWRKLKLSSDCIRAAAEIYTFDPDFLYQRASAQDSAAAKDVLTFFLGMYISASWNRTMFVPFRTNPTRL